VWTVDAVGWSAPVYILRWVSPLVRLLRASLGSRQLKARPQQKPQRLALGPQTYITTTTSCHVPSSAKSVTKNSKTLIILAYMRSESCLHVYRYNEIQHNWSWRRFDEHLTVDFTAWFYRHGLCYACCSGQSFRVTSSINFSFSSSHYLQNACANFKLFLWRMHELITYMGRHVCPSVSPHVSSTSIT
jgi:hypothetical protein